MNKYFITLAFLFSFVFVGSAHSADINCSKVLSKESSDNPEENFKKAYCNIKKEKFRSAKKNITKVGSDLPSTGRPL